MKNYKPRPCPNCGILTETTNSRARFCSEECRKINALSYAKNYHGENKIERNIAAKEKRKQNKTKAVEYMGGKCIDCNGIFPLAVYDFHHLDPSQKDIPLGFLMNWNWGVQQKELDKCVLLCSNCHRVRHHPEGI